MDEGRGARGGDACGVDACNRVCCQCVPVHTEISGGRAQHKSMPFYVARGPEVRVTPVLMQFKPGMLGVKSAAQYAPSIPLVLPSLLSVAAAVNVPLVAAAAVAAAAVPVFSVLR